MLVNRANKFYQITTRRFSGYLPQAQRFPAISIGDFSNGDFDINSARNLLAINLKPLNQNFASVLDELCPTTGGVINPLMNSILTGTCYGGKMNRGALAIFSTLKILQFKGREITPEMLKCTVVIGWSIEVMQSYLLVMDDIMDESITRRGNPCWYKKPGVGLRAINDSLLMIQLVGEAIDKAVPEDRKFRSINALFRRVALQTGAGQHLDWDATTKSAEELTKWCTMDRYLDIIRYKTAIYTFKLPITAGLLLAEMWSEPVGKYVDEISFRLGELFQVQDDYIDCFADPTESGKIGTDIEDLKCTWLLVKALSLASKEQISKLVSCLGSSDKNEIQMVKDIYGELQLPALFAEYEVETSESINQVIERSSDIGLPSEIFVQALALLKHRRK